MNKFITIFAVSVLMFSVPATAVTVPNTFTANTPAVASEVNENFEALENGINNIINSHSFREATLTDASGTGISSCLANEQVISAGCWCTGSHKNGSNYGILSMCLVVGNSAVGSCYPEGITFNQNLASSPVEVTAVCARNLVDSASKTFRSDSSDYEIVGQEELDVIERVRQQVDAMYERLTNK